MAIDKDQEPILKAMINASYSGVILRTICHYVLIDLAEISSSMKISSSRHMNLLEKLIMYDQELQSDHVKKSLLCCLNMIKRKRDDIVNEIIRQYGLTLAHDEIDFYQDEMGFIFDDFIKYTRDLIQAGEYGMLRSLVNNPQA